MDGCRPSPTASLNASLVVFRATERERRLLGECHIIGIGLTMNVLQVHGAAADGTVLSRKKLVRPGR